MTVHRLLAFAFAVHLAACTSFGGGTPPPYPEIDVTPIDDLRTYGARADYVVKAPLAAVEKVLLDFDMQARVRPMIVSVKRTSGNEEAGTMRVVFREGMGFSGAATLAYRTSRSDDSFEYTYQMTDSDLSLWRLSGGFRLHALDDGRATYVRQEFKGHLMSVNKDALLENVRSDAAAVRKAAERGGGTSPRRRGP